MTIKIKNKNFVISFTEDEMYDLYVDLSALAIGAMPDISTGKYDGILGILKPYFEPGK